MMPTVASTAMQATTAVTARAASMRRRQAALPIARKAGRSVATASVTVLKRPHVGVRLQQFVALSHHQPKAMSKTIYEGPSVTVASYCGPALRVSPEWTRMRVQIEVTANGGITTLSHNQVLALHFALGQWLHDNQRTERTVEVRIVHPDHPSPESTDSEDEGEHPSDSNAATRDRASRREEP